MNLIGQIKEKDGRTMMMVKLETYPTTHFKLFKNLHQNCPQKNDFNLLKDIWRGFKTHIRSSIKNSLLMIQSLNSSLTELTCKRDKSLMKLWNRKSLLLQSKKRINIKILLEIGTMIELLRDPILKMLLEVSEQIRSREMKISYINTSTTLN